MFLKTAALMNHLGSVLTLLPRNHRKAIWHRLLQNTWSYRVARRHLSTLSKRANAQDHLMTRPPSSASSMRVLEICFSQGLARWCHQTSERVVKPSESSSSTCTCTSLQSSDRWVTTQQPISISWPISSLEVKNFLRLLNYCRSSHYTICLGRNSTRPSSTSSEKSGRLTFERDCRNFWKSTVQRINLRGSNNYTIAGA